MKKQFSRNIPSLTREEQEKLAQKHVLVVGCGGLGGYVVEHLARLGVGRLTVADYDDFEETNLNRQLLSTRDVLGRPKVAVAEARVKAINPDAVFRPLRSAVSKDTADAAVQGVDLVIDALDNMDDRLVLEEACARANLPLVHGAVVGWLAQVMVATPGSGSLRRLYEHDRSARSSSTLSVTPAFCAAIQAGEAVKLLCGRGSGLEDRVLAVDLETLEWRIAAPGEQLFAPKQVRITLEQNYKTDELNVAPNMTIKQVVDSMVNYADNAYILCNGWFVSPEDAQTTIVEDGDMICVRRAVPTGG